MNGEDEDNLPKVMLKTKIKIFELKMWKVKILCPLEGILISI